MVSERSVAHATSTSAMKPLARWCGSDRFSLPTGPTTHIRSQTVLILLASAALLGPCFWQPFIHGGDLPSHLYNAWLANLIKQGHAPGLWIARQWTNVAFDMALGWLVGTFGAGWAERIAVPAAILVFFWGAFALVRTVTGQRPWLTAPCLAMLAYGFVFQMGLFNFYVSAGLALFLLAIVWGGTLRDRIVAFPVLLLAWLAHPLPVLWLFAAATYVCVGRKLSPRHQALLFLASLGAIFLLRHFLLGHFVTHWSSDQLLFFTGADQVVVFGLQYWLITLMILLLWGTALFESRRWAQIAWGLPSQLFLINGAGIFLLPNFIYLYGHAAAAASQIPERMSLFSGVLACTLVEDAKPKKWLATGFALVAALYFCFLYADAHAITRVENKIDSLVSQLPPMQRILAFPELYYGHGSKIEDFVGQFPLVWRVLLLPRYRVDLIHIADRVCIGRCFDFGNFEPSTRQFRIRALPGNAIVVWDDVDLRAMAKGTYVVKQSDFPIFQIYYCSPPAIDLCIRPLNPGEVNGKR